MARKGQVARGWESPARALGRQVRIAPEVEVVSHTYASFGFVAPDHRRPGAGPESNRTKLSGLPQWAGGRYRANLSWGDSGERARHRAVSSVFPAMRTVVGPPKAPRQAPAGP